MVIVIVINSELMLPRLYYRMRCYMHRKILQKHDKQHHLSITGERHLVCNNFFKRKYFIK